MCASRWLAPASLLVPAPAFRHVPLLPPNTPMLLTHECAATLPPTQELNYPQPRGWEDPDRSTVGAPSPNGAAGTYNHLVDAMLDVNATRAM
jgi:hypothetical protein